MNILHFLTLGFSLAIINYGQSKKNAMNNKESITGVTHTIKTKLSDGIYKSDENSYRQNFYLKIAGDSATLFGWEPVYELKERINNKTTPEFAIKDTIYYRTSTKFLIDKKGSFSLKFNNYELSHTPIMKDDIDGFVQDKKIQFETFGLHNYFDGIISDIKLIVTATKDIYDSRGDHFEFIKIK